MTTTKPLVSLPDEHQTTRNIGTVMATTNPLVSMPDEQPITGNMGAKMAMSNPLVSLPVKIFSNILDYLDWGDVGRFDTAFLDRKTRNRYLFTLMLRKVKVERNGFWEKALERGKLSWLISKNIRVISWDLKVDNAQLISIASGFPQLQSMNISGCSNITDKGIRALTNGPSQLQYLNIGCCVKITDKGVIALANGLLPQLQSLNINRCRKITDAGVRVLAIGLPQLQSLNISGCYKITDAGIEIAERINSLR